MGLQCSKAVRGYGNDLAYAGREECTSHLDYEYHRLTLRAVGRLLWLVPIRPDLRSLSKELSRAPKSSTYHDYGALNYA